MAECDKCGKNVPVDKIKRHKRFRCKGRKKEMPKRRNRGTGLTPSEIMALKNQKGVSEVINNPDGSTVTIIGGSRDQKKMVKKSLKDGEIDV